PQALAARAGDRGDRAGSHRRGARGHQSEHGLDGHLRGVAGARRDRGRSGRPDQPVVARHGRRARPDRVRHHHPRRPGLTARGDRRWLRDRDRRGDGLDLHLGRGGRGGDLRHPHRGPGDQAHGDLRGGGAAMTMALSPRALGVALVALALLLAPVAFSEQQYLLRVVTTAAIYAIAAYGLNIILGLTGQLSLAHGAFFGLGAYTVGLLTTDYDWSFW